MEYPNSKYKTFEDHLEEYNSRVRYYAEAIYKDEDLPVFVYKIEEYFKKCKKEKIPARTSGLILELGLCKDGFKDYRARKVFNPACKRAILRIEDALVGIALKADRRNIGGPLFILKCNHQYIEKKSINFGNSVTLKIDKDDAELLG